MSDTPFIARRREWQRATFKPGIKWHYAQAGWLHTSCGIPIKKVRNRISTRADTVDCLNCRNGKYDTRDAARELEARAARTTGEPIHD